MKRVLLCFALVGMLIVGSKAQQFECPPQDTCGGWQSASRVIRNREAPPCQATVYYRSRQCGGRLEVYIDSIRKDVGCEGWDRLRHLYVDYSGFEDYMGQRLLDSLTLSSAPPCSVDSATAALYYPAACSAWVWCAYFVHKDSILQNGCPGITDPNVQQVGSDSVLIRTGKWQGCGRVCCMKIYKICSDGNRRFIRLVEKRKVEECEGRRPENNPNPYDHCYDGC